MSGRFLCTAIVRQKPEADLGLYRISSKSVLEQLGGFVPALYVCGIAIFHLSVFLTVTVLVIL